MAEQGTDDHDHDEEKTLYKPPAKKGLNEILDADPEDESLRKYKESLLGCAAGDLGTIADASDPRNVIVSKLALIIKDRDEITLDLTGDLGELKKSPLALKEGCSYQVRIYFRVQREIVTGLRYKHKVSRKGVPVDSQSSMVGSYGPKKELQSYTSPVEEAPSGMLARGDYTIKSKFTDDDKNIYLEWEWKLQIKKDWE